MTHPLAVVALKTATLFLGGMITFYSFRAWRRTRSRALRALTVGFGVITLGSLVAGVIDQLVVVDRQVALIVESALTAVGFAVILYSLFAD